MRILQKYKNDKMYKEKVKLKSKLKYTTYYKHKEQLKEINKKKYKAITEQKPEIRKIFADKTLTRREYTRTRNIRNEKRTLFQT